MSAGIAVGLACLTALLAGPVPAALSKATWPGRCPRAALVLWQAVGLAGWLAAVGTGLVIAVAPLAATLPHGLHTLAGQLLAGAGLRGLGPGQLAALAWAVALCTWVVAWSARAGGQSLRERRRHKLLIDLLAAPATDLAGARVLEHPRPVVYCLPGWPSRVVVSTGTWTLLDDTELGAALTHERAHARERHDLVLLPFVALAHALPFLPATRHARDAVAALVEMLADDHARAVYGGRVLARALASITAGAGPAPAGALAAATDASAASTSTTTPIGWPAMRTGAISGSRWRSSSCSSRWRRPWPCCPGPWHCWPTRGTCSPMRARSPPR